LEEVARRLQALPDKVERKVLAQAVEKSGQPMKAAAKQKAPRGMPRRHPKSTPLHRAIVFKKRKAKRGLVWFELGIDYTKNRVGHLVEFGHRLVRNGKQYGVVLAKPFIRPAYDETKEKCAKDMEHLIAAGVEREAEKLGRGGH